ncbi:MAG: restriction endonuclease subunit S [Methylococcales bacterium]|nr:restriction endonuclease subunit S [Methylococcales bacterium]
MKAGWQMKKLGEVCEVIAGQSPEGKYFNSEMRGLPFYQGKKEFSEKFLGEPTTWTTETTKEARQGDVLMSVRAPVGPVNFATQRICIGRGLAAIRATEVIDRDYLFNFLLKHESEVVGNTGAVFNSINKTQIENILIPIPPLPEQQRIVAILDEAFEGIATAVANAKKNLNNARELFESTVQSVFANKGDGWEEKRFDEICVLQRGFDLPTHSRNEGNYPLVSSNGITDKIDLWKVKAPGVVTGRSGTIGNVHFIEEDYWPLNTALYVKEFYGNYERCIYYFLKQFDLGKYRSGAGVPTLNRNNVHSEMVWFSKAITEQQRIVAKLDELSAETKKLEAIYQQKLTALDALKKSILNQAFAGEL